MTTDTGNLTPSDERVAWLHRLSQSFHASLDLEEVLGRVMDEVMAGTRAKRGLVMLLEAGGRPVVRAARGMDGSTLDVPQFQNRLAVAEQVVREGQAVVAEVEQRPHLCVPIPLGDEILGAIYVDKQVGGGAFGEDALDLLAAIAAAAAQAIDNARLHEGARQRSPGGDALWHKGLRLTSSLEMPAVLDSVAESALALVGANECLIYLYDEDSDRFSFGTAAGRWAATGAVLAPRPSGLTATVIEKGGPVVIDDAAAHPLFAGPQAQQWGIQAAAGIPLRRAGRALGVLNVAFTEPHSFRPEELQVLELLADEAAIAIENARLFAAARTQLEELTVLHAVATAGAEATQEDALIRRVTQIIGETLYPADVFGVMLLDETAGVLHVHPSYHTMEEKRERWEAALSQLVTEETNEIVVPVGQGITGTVAASGQSLRVGDVTVAPQYIDADVGTQSELCVPLIVGERVIGVINAESTEPDAFSEADERLLATVAGQLATAIEKLRLYEAAQQEIAERVRAEEELRQHRDQLEELVDERTSALTEANLQLEHEIGERLKHEEELRRQKEYFEALFVNNPVAVVTIDLEGRVISWNPMAEKLYGYTQSEAIGQDVDDLVAADESIREEARSYTRIVAEAGRVRTTTRRTRKDGSLVDVEMLGLPMIVGGERFGYLALYHDISERVRVEAERERLLAAERAQARRQAALFRLSAELAATLEDDEVCRRVVDGLHDTLGYDFVAIFVVDKDTGDRVHAASAGPIVPPARIPAGQGLSGRPLLDGQLHYTPDVGQEPDYIYWLGGSEVDVPLRIGEEVLGVLIVESARPDAFDEEDFEVLTAAVQQAGLALEKARLLEAERRRADELEALRTTMADLTAELELPALLQAIVERAAGLLDATGGELGLYDEASQEVRIVVSYNLDKDYTGTRHALGEGAMGLVAETGEPLAIEDYQAWSGRAAEYTGVPLHAVLASPLEVGGRLVGVITLATAEAARQFGPADLHLLKLFGQQAAIAIENARLYADLRTSQEYARNIIDSSLDPIIAVDQDRRIVEFNRAAHETFGYRPEEILGQHVDVLYAQPPSGQEIHQTTLQDGGYTQEVMNRRKSGEVFPSIVSASPLRDAQGELVGVMGISRDITERKRAEEELRRYQEHLEELVEERTAELRESEQLYRTLFDGVPVGLYRTTPAGEVMDANPAMVQILGFESREEALAVDSAKLYVDPEERVRWQDLMEREGTVRDFETRMYRQDGTVIWVNNTARAMRDDEGQVLYYEGSLEDITERKRAEEELRQYQEHLEELVEERTAELQESEKRYRTLFDGVPVGLYRSTPGGQVLDANQAAVQLLDYPSREALLATNVAEFFVRPLEGARARLMADRDGVVRDLESRLYKHDGTELWVNYTTRIVRDEQGQALHYEGSLQDITQRKRFEEEIRRQKEYFEALFVGSPVAVLTVDREARVTAWNPMAERLYGYTREEAVGRNLDELVANHPSIREEARGYSEEAISGRRVQATTRRTRKDGSFVDVEVLALPIIAGGEQVAFMVMYYDIGELQQARREAEAANQAKSTFLANMSHELRTPLNAILGFSQLMDGDPNLTAGQQENLQIINRSGEHLLTLINDVLDMSKIEAGRVTLRETHFDLYDLLDSLEEMFRLRAEEKGLTCSFRRTADVPRYAMADEGKLRQVLSNLLGNAVKFTAEGGVALRLSSAGSDGETQALHFEVEDTGPGIAPEDLGAVFDPFVQVAGWSEFVAAPGEEGTGLGLSISRQFARLMGGDIAVESEPGHGSLFAFDLPVGLSPVGEVEAEVARPGRRDMRLAPGQLAPDGGPFRLLVVEDRETNRRLLVKLLSSQGPSAGSGQGFEIQEATNGQEAILAWEQWQPHLIWMDMRMPVMGGGEATRRIKARPGGKDTVIVALTATAFEEDRERILLEGCDDFVRKPFRAEEICEMLSKHLGVRFECDEEEAPAVVAGVEEAPPAPAGVAEADPLVAGLAATPAEWRAELEEATVQADLNRILALADGIREEDAALARAVADLAQDFQYRRLQALIEQATGAGR